MRTSWLLALHLLSTGSFKTVENLLTQLNMAHCEICKSEASSDNGLFEAPFFSEQKICATCWSSNRMRDWVRKNERENLLFKRYMTLRSIRSVTCPSCQSENLIVPKFTGHSPSWELCCNRCANICIDAFDYQEDLTVLFDASRRFDTSREPLDALIALVGEWPLAEVSKPCDVCGGYHSVLAKPRCIQCGEIVFDSIFHFSDVAT